MDVKEAACNKLIFEGELIFNDMAGLLVFRFTYLMNKPINVPTDTIAICIKHSASTQTLFITILMKCYYQTMAI